MPCQRQRPTCRLTHRCRCRPALPRHRRLRLLPPIVDSPQVLAGPRAQKAAAHMILLRFRHRPGRTANRAACFRGAQLRPRRRRQHRLLRQRVAVGARHTLIQQHGMCWLLPQQRFLGISPPLETPSRLKHTAANGWWIRGCGRLFFMPRDAAHAGSMAVCDAAAIKVGSCEQRCIPYELLPQLETSCLGYPLPRA